MRRSAPCKRSHAVVRRQLVIGGGTAHALAAAVFGVLWLASVPPSAALPDGISGYSGKDGGETCGDRCHSGGDTPAVRFEGPPTVTAGTQETFRFLVEVKPPTQSRAGFDVSASTGTLGVVSGQGTHLDSGEVTHDAARAAVDSTVTWDFTWRAPTKAGTATLYGAGLSADGSTTTNGDGTKAATHAITVTTPCTGDCNNDKLVSVNELMTGLGMAFGTGGACAAFDATGDQHVTVDEVVAAIDNAINGCFPATPIVFSGEGNRLNAYDVSKGAPFRKQTVIQRRSLDPKGFDINAQICFMHDGSRRFIAGEDTLQTEGVPQAFGFFQLNGSKVGQLSATRLSRLTETYQPGANPEQYGCGFLSDGRLVTTDIGKQASGDGTGQLTIWFPPFDVETPRYCKIDTGIATAGGIAIDDLDRVYIASARSAFSGTPREFRPAGMHRYTGPFPTSDDTAGGCGRTDNTGAPLADTVERELFIPQDEHASTPYALVRLPTGHFYVSSVFNGVIAEYDANGQFVGTILQPLDEEARPYPSTGTPLGISLTADGTIYYADIAIVDGPDGPGPGDGLGKVRRIRFVNGQPQPPETMDSQLDFPDGIGILEELGARQFALHRPETQFFSTGLPGSDVSQGLPWLLTTLKLVAGARDQNGIAPLWLAEDAIFGFTDPLQGTVCMKLYAQGSHGSIDCDGGSSHDVIVTLDSHGADHGDPLAVETGKGSDGGPGAATIQLMQSYMRLPDAPGVDACKTAVFTPPQPTAYTTKKATAKVVNALQGVPVSVSKTGKNFSCTDWSAAAGRPVLVGPIPAEDAPIIEYDVANVAVLAEQ